MSGKENHHVEFSERDFAELERAGIRLHAGYTGAFTRNNALGAWTAGTRIKKVWGEEGDRHALGEKGTVLGSIIVPDAGVMYFIEWDTQPRCAVATIAKKIGAL